jgi:uncharacterized protein
MSRKQKHIPKRMCVVCRDKIEKRRLTRIVRTASGLQIDPSGKHDGRGAYVCDQATCRERVATSDILSKALRVRITDADRQRIRELAS